MQISKPTLSRFDINYSRENKKDKISSSEFLENCCMKLKRTNYKVQLEKNRKGFILKIGNRKANHYLRIYQQNNFLKFEYEMKDRFLQKFHKLLVLNNFEEMEFNFMKQFFYRFGKLLPLQYSYLDWLVIKLRPQRQQLISKDTLHSDYIKSEIKTDSEKLITLLQFLNYAESLDYRDPQTWAKNEKSVKELDIIQNAAEEGLVNMQDIRRPIDHRNETTGDFINSQTGETYEIKSITQFFSSSGKSDKSFKQSASDIANKIISKEQDQDSPVADKYFINAKEVPKYQQQEYIDQIQEQLEKANVLQKIDITFLKN